MRRIVNDGILSNVWQELPFGRIPHENVIHDHSEEILIVVCDTLIDDHSELERVRLKDVEIMNERVIGHNTAEVESQKNMDDDWER